MVGWSWYNDCNLFSYDNIEYLFYKDWFAFKSSCCFNLNIYLIGLGRISGLAGYQILKLSIFIPDIEIIRPDIQASYILSLTLLKLSGRTSENLVFYIKQHWYYPVRSDIRPIPNIKYIFHGTGKVNGYLDKSFFSNNNNTVLMCLLRF